MSKTFFPSLALQNIRKNGKFYFPYILSCVLTVAGFYNMCAVSYDKAVSQMTGADSVKLILNLGCIVVGLFAAIFLFYTNSFLMKRRKKELGLYNILGMEKRHIGKILVWESVFVSVGSIVMGLIIGMVFSKLLLMILFKVLFFEVHFGFSVSLVSVIITVMLFAVIFLLSLVSNLAKIHMTNPIELLRGSNTGESEPKSKWLLALIGFLCLGGGYYIALATKSPIDAVGLFFIAVILVIIGTYCLFTAGSIAVLKMLRRNKKFYYQTKHFTAVSGMIYRMKRNAVGLANICILCTMVLVMVSTTVSMYMGTEDALDNRYPHEIAFSVPEDVLYDGYRDDVTRAVKEITEKHGLEISNSVNYSAIDFAALHEGNDFSLKGDVNYMVDASKVAYVAFITAEDYMNSTGNTVALEKNQVIASNLRGKDNAEKLNICGDEYEVLSWTDDVPMVDEYMSYVYDVYCFVVADEDVLNSFIEKQIEAYNGSSSVVMWNYAFDISGTAEEIKSCYGEIVDNTRIVTEYGDTDDYGNPILDENGNQVMATHESNYARCRQEAADEFYAMYGSFLFLGIFLGVLFLMVTALIIYYKQISEGYEDKERFEIMQKVGMSEREVRNSVKSQVLLVFFLPLAVAIIHLAFAFKIIIKLLALFNLTNVTLFVLCTLITIGVFAVVYGIVYSLTTGVYYRIVNGEKA